MPVAEMCSRMSAHELMVEWPAFYAYRERKARREEEEEKARSRRV